ARLGAKTILVERFGCLGGLPTTNLVGALSGFCGSTAFKFGRMLQRVPLILGGIPVEIIERLRALGGVHQGDRFTWESIPHDPEVFKYVADRMVEEANIKVFLHTWAVAATVEDNRITAVITESKSGRRAIRGKVFVDATGDADVAFHGGVAYTKGRSADGKTEPMGSYFKVGGVRRLTGEEFHKGVDAVTGAINEGKLFASYHGVEYRPSNLRDDEITPCITRVAGDATNVEDITRAEIEGRKQTWEYVQFIRENIAGYNGAYLSQTPIQFAPRETRQIKGLYTLTGEDIHEGHKFEDGVARTSFFIDIHCPRGKVAGGRTVDYWVCSRDCKMDPNCYMKTKFPDELLPFEKIFFKKEGDWCDIPYRSLIPDTIDNLLVSGRCISATHQAMASLRVVGPCMAIGQAAGTAAALCVEKGVVPRSLEIRSLKDALKAAGVLLDNEVRYVARKGSPVANA
ncbi:MAG: FAD-dependent oxidoreductase, partial [Deltaproteobacteria bacterium]|nr:FAD-dependent oxidoreductase [Deltaproteobacteria bacterium]